MDLFASWKMCLQCLPIFSPQPLLSPPLSAVPLHPTPAATPNLSKGDSTAETDLQEAEKPSFSDASLAPDHQHQGLPLSDYTKDAGPLDYALPVVESNYVAANGNLNTHSDHHAHSRIAAQALLEDDESTPPPSPVTYAPIGLGSILGHHRPLHHIHHQVHSAVHSHGHDKLPPSPPHSTSNEQYTGPHISSSESANDRDDDKEAARLSMDDPHVQGLQTPTTPHLETFYSAADIELAASLPHDAYEDDNMAMLESSISTSESSHSGPVDGVRISPMRRRREQFKLHLQDLRNQLKQGGQQLRKEGTKHLQKIMSAKNKRGHPNEKSGSSSSSLRSARPD